MIMNTADAINGTQTGRAYSTVTRKELIREAQKTIMDQDCVLEAQWARAIKIQEEQVEFLRQYAEDLKIQSKRFIQIAAEFERWSLTADAQLAQGKAKLREMECGKLRGEKLQ